MKLAVKLNLHTQKMQFEIVDVSDVKEMFKKIAQIQELFDVGCCGKCKSTRIVCSFRVAQDKYDYYSLSCMDCGAEFHFGQKMDAEKTLFPKYKDKEGNWLPDNGWTKYQGGGGGGQDRDSAY